MKQTADEKTSGKLKKYPVYSLKIPATFLFNRSFHYKPRTCNTRLSVDIITMVPRRDRNAVFISTRFISMVRSMVGTGTFPA